MNLLLLLTPPAALRVVLLWPVDMIVNASTVDGDDNILSMHKRYRYGDFVDATVDDDKEDEKDDV